MVSALRSTPAILGDPSPASGSSADPVFVLCNGRSGSTLLRFLLDAHPDLACPPETNLPALCAQLATVWSLIEGAPLSAKRGDEPPDVPDAAIAGVRETMDRMVASYLERRGKRRYCDKSLGTARFAELLLRIYPEARFLCLYRHPMDVIASGVEACPWGLTGYGFDPYIASTPGNAVLALARFWADNVATIAAAEERFPDKCLRVRYEDLVTDPEATAAGIFEFLDVAAVPGISRECFSAERERSGPADHKIWYTSAISSDSAGRGWSIPAAMIAPDVLATVNELAARLGYLQVDGGWGTSAPPADLRVTIDPADTGIGSPAADGPAAAEPRAPRPAPHGPVHSAMLGEQLGKGLARSERWADGRWLPHRAETMVAVSIPEDPHQPAEHWLVDFAAQAVTFTDGDAQEDSDWDVVGSASAWESVMSGRLNLNAALRACRLRYCDNSVSGGPLLADNRLALLADVLALTSW